MAVGTVLSLCDKTGNMVRPWAEAGYECWCLDIQHEGWRCDESFPRTGGRIHKIRHDVTRPFTLHSAPDIVFAFPPCTHLAVSGARWFQVKGMDALIEALEVVNACRKIAESSGAPYMIENPVSTLSTYWRKPDYTFDPCEYAGYLEDPDEDAYSKKTCLWTGGGFVMPQRKPVHPIHGSKMHLMAPSDDRSDRRAETPRGLSKAVFLANARTAKTEAA
jgi:hypothetical protein